MEIRVFHTLDPRAMALLETLAGDIPCLLKELQTMRASLAAAILASQQLAASETDLKTSIVAYVNDEPNRQKAAVAEALAAAGVDDDKAAELIQAAATTAQGSIADTLAAITTPGTGAPASTPASGQGDDTLNLGGAGNDVITGGDGNTPAGGAGDDTLNNGSGGDVVTGAEAATQNGGTDTPAGGTGDDTLNAGTGGDAQPPANAQ